MKVYCSRQPNNVLRQLVNRGAWVRVFIRHPGIDEDYKAWIKILSIEDSTDICNFLEYQICGEPVAWNIPINEIEVEYPYEILTDSEFDDFIADIKSRFGM